MTKNPKDHESELLVEGIRPYLEDFDDDFARERAVELLKDRNADFLAFVDNTRGLHTVFFNSRLLKKLDIYEESLLAAWIDTRTNHSSVPPGEIRQLFQRADREKLRAAGEPLPGPGPFTLFRGVAGKGRKRRIRGISWTSSYDKARWFAQRSAVFVGDPGVYTVTVPEKWVLAFTDERNEKEFLLLLPKHIELRRVG